MRMEDLPRDAARRLSQMAVAEQRRFIAEMDPADVLRLTPAAIKRSLGLEPSSCEASGVLSDVAIREADLLSGRWDGATMRLSVVDWSDQAAPTVNLMTGRLGAIQAKGDEFSADLLGAAAALDAPVCPQTSPECRAELGDRQCRVDMAGRTLRVTVTGQNGSILSLDQAVDDRFLFGMARVVGGASHGLSYKIVEVEGKSITLRAPGWLRVEAGTRLLIRQGCDKRLDTCAARFGNAENFRGEPHLPGNDLLTRYPGG